VPWSELRLSLHLRKYLNFRWCQNLSNDIHQGFHPLFLLGNSTGSFLVFESQEQSMIIRMNHAVSSSIVFEIVQHDSLPHIPRPYRTLPW
jgi:hypothetical protein